MGALACALTSIKIVISNQSAHWPTIQNITHGTAAGPRWVTRLKSVFTEPGEMQTKPTELHCRFYSRSVFSHLWLLRAYWCHVSSVVPSRHYPFFHMFPSRGKKRAGVGEGGTLLVQADEENKQVQIWFLVEVERASRRVCHQTHLHPSRFSPHPPHRFHPSVRLREALFTFDAPPSPHRWGGAVHHHSWGTQISMQPPLHRHKPVVTKSPNPPLHLAAELD